MSLASFVILAACIAAVASQQLTVNTPTSVVHCLPVQITWSGGSPPYYVSLLPGGQPSATPLADLGQQTGTSLSWKATLPANTPVTVQIRDSTGTLNYSDQFTIQSGTATCDAGAAPTSPTTSSSPSTSTGVAAVNSSASKTPVSTNSSSAAAKSTNTSTPSAAGSTPGTPGSTPASSPGSSSSLTTSTSPANGSATASDARNEASRASAGFMAVAVAAVVAVFA